MTSRPATQASAFLLALVATLATVGAVDRLAARPGDQSWMTQVATASTDASRATLVEPTFQPQRIVVTARRARA